MATERQKPRADGDLHRAGRGDLQPGEVSIEVLVSPLFGRHQPEDAVKRGQLRELGEKGRPSDLVAVTGRLRVEGAADDHLHRRANYTGGDRTSFRAPDRSQALVPKSR